jgi:hypothetical protein
MGFAIGVDKVAKSTNFIAAENLAAIFLRPPYAVLSTFT